MINIWFKLEFERQWNTPRERDRRRKREGERESAVTTDSVGGNS